MVGVLTLAVPASACSWVIGPYCSIDAKPDVEQAGSGLKKKKKKKKKGSLGESFSGERRGR